MNAMISPPASREGVRGSVDELQLPDGIHRLPNGALKLVGFAAISAYASDTCPGCADCTAPRTTRDTYDLR